MDTFSDWAFFAPRGMGAAYLGGFAGFLTVAVFGVLVASMVFFVVAELPFVTQSAAIKIA